MPLILALLLNEVVHHKFMRMAQTVFFLPYFLFWAVMGGVLRNLFQYDGMVNELLGRIGIDPIMFLGSNTWFPIIIILSDVWKDMGYNMIIFLAAITGVDPALNESAALDGANRWQQIWHITLPTIRPIVVMLLVLSLGSVLSAGMEQIMLLYNPMVYKSSDIIDTLVYRLGLVNHQWSLSTAVGMMKSVVSFMLIKIIMPINTRNSLSTARLLIRLFSVRPAMPPPMPPAIIKTRAGRVNSGTLWVIRVVSRLVIWLNRMMYRLFCAAVLVSMLKK